MNYFIQSLTYFRIFIAPLIFLLITFYDSYVWALFLFILASISDYWEIDRFCKEIGIEWFFSAWDINSQIEMRIFNSKYNKVASAMATNHEFLKLVASERKHTFMSTGMMNMDEIKNALDIFIHENCPVTLLHTVSTYPAEESTLNLKCINTLKDKFNVPVGYLNFPLS